MVLTATFSFDDVYGGWTSRNVKSPSNCPRGPLQVQAFLASHRKPQSLESRDSRSISIGLQTNLWLTNMALKPATHRPKRSSQVQTMTLMLSELMLAGVSLVEYVSVPSMMNRWTNTGQLGQQNNSKSSPFKQSQGAQQAKWCHQSCNLHDWNSRKRSHKPC